MWRTKSRLWFQIFHFFSQIPKTFPSPPRPCCSLPPLIFGRRHRTPPMPPLVKLTIQNWSRHQLKIWPKSTRHNNWRRSPSYNREVTSLKIQPNATTNNFSLLLSGFSLVLGNRFLVILLIMLFILLISKSNIGFLVVVFCFYLFLV